jgi:ABC-type branched-subunit amino acid transport system substrate-binding protein
MKYKMKQNPYQTQKAAPHKQVAYVDVTLNGKSSNHIVICFSDDCEDVIFSKARRKAIEYYGSQVKNVALDYKITKREDL